MISQTALEAIGAEHETLTALVERQERELAIANASKEAWKERCQSLVGRVTELHVTLFRQQEEQRQHIKELQEHVDAISQQVTTLNMRAGL